MSDSVRVIERDECPRHGAPPAGLQACDRCERSLQPVRYVAGGLADIGRAARLAARRDIEREPDAQRYARQGMPIDPDEEWRTQPEEYREAWRAKARWWADALNVS